MSRIVLIAAATEGYRRGGLKFGKVPIEVDLDALEDGPAVAIETDPNLTIKLLEIGEDCSELRDEIASLRDQLDRAHNEIDNLNQRIMELEGSDIGEVVEAIGKLNIDVAANFTKKTGKPEIKPLEELLGRNVSADERDKAWEKFQAAGGYQTNSVGDDAQPSGDE